jgi:hypothetical protein
MPSEREPTAAEHEAHLLRSVAVQPFGYADGGDPREALWEQFKTGDACCPRDGLVLPLHISEVVTPIKGNSYRFCCVACGFSTQPFVVVEGVVTSI